ncbi:MAG: M48 family metallopeptidase [bacterium]|nr:M48 family metallopeptidase [bacterium]
MSLFFIIIIALGWFVSYYYQSPAILYIAVIFSIFMNVASYWWSDKLVLALTGAKPASREAFFDLYTVTENLSITAGLPMPKLYVINDPAPNAFATGRNKEHAVVAATTGLLQMLERNELEGVIAHELSHIGNKDMLVSTVVVVLVGFVTLLADFFLRSMHWGGSGGRSDNNGGRIGGILVLIGIVLTILSPIIATLIQLAISRKREFLADASGALLTRYPDGLASALRKIAQYNRPMQRANNATAHLFISNPFGSEKSKTNFFARMFMTHPPVQDRIRALVGINESH